MKEKGNNLHEKIADFDFIASLAYLSDAFTMLNDLNISIQGHNVILVDA
jgi:hypothetical protein